MRSFAATLVCAALAVGCSSISEEEANQLRSENANLRADIERLVEQGDSPTVDEVPTGSEDRALAAEVLQWQIEACAARWDTAAERMTDATSFAAYARSAERSTDNSFLAQLLDEAAGVKIAGSDLAASDAAWQHGDCAAVQDAADVQRARVQYEDSRTRWLRESEQR